MAEKIKLTPEMEAALKKANLSDADIQKVVNADVQKISLNELDGLSGGAGSNDDPYEPRICGMTREEMGSLLQGIVDSFGIDVAVAVALTWVQTSDWETWLRASRGCNEGRYAVNMLFEKFAKSGKKGGGVF